MVEYVLFCLFVCFFYFRHSCLRVVSAWQLQSGEMTPVRKWIMTIIKRGNHYGSTSTQTGNQLETTMIVEPTKHATLSPDEAKK